MRFQTNLAPVPGLPPPVTSGGLQSFIDQTGSIWVAKPGVNGGQWRLARDVLHAVWHKNTAFSLTTTVTTIAYDFLQLDDYGLYSTAVNAFVIPVGGIYRIEQQVSGTPTATGQWIGCQLLQNATFIGNSTSHGTNAAWLSSWNNMIVRAAVNDHLFGQGNAPVTLAGRFDTTGVTHIALDYWGTG